MINRLRHFIKRTFGFSRVETNGFIILIPIILIALFSQPLYHTYMAAGRVDYSRESAMLDSMLAQLEITTPAPATSIEPVDPNTASVDLLIQAGISGKIAERVVAYRNSGRPFQTKDDLLKVYGMDTASLANIHIAPFTEPSKQKNTTPKAELTKFDLNAIDSGQLVKIYGIGPTLSRRIIRYRESLGGFVDLTQLTEVYGLDSIARKNVEAITFIHPEFHPAQLDINTATEAALAAHPYISKTLARSLVTYRFQHGYYHSFDDLEKKLRLQPREIHRLMPYLSISSETH